MSTHDEPIPRMKAEDRRELVLIAATGVFGDRGYVATTTDQVAKAAGVSQPYVVRMFGTKEQLFLEVLGRALDRLLVTFRGVLAESSDNLSGRLGLAYVELLRDRGLLLSLMHGFLLGADPVIGPVVRRGFLNVYRFLREEAGFTAEASQRFLEGGMMLNTLVGLRMSDDFESDPSANELLCAALPQKLDVVLDLGAAQRAEQR